MNINIYPGQHGRAGAGGPVVEQRWWSGGCSRGLAFRTGSGNVVFGNTGIGALKRGGGFVPPLCALWVGCCSLAASCSCPLPPESLKENGLWSHNGGNLMGRAEVKCGRWEGEGEGEGSRGLIAPTSLPPDNGKKQRRLLIFHCSGQAVPGAARPLDQRFISRCIANLSSGFAGERRNRKWRGAEGGGGSRRSD